MKTCVVDASVIAAAFFQEDHSGRAHELLVGDCILRAPDLVYPELASVIWKRHNRGEMDANDAGAMLTDLRRLDLHITPCGDLVESALEVALSTGRSVYDCLYLALALKHNCIMVTADKRLVNALAGGPLAKYIALIGGKN